MDKLYLLHKMLIASFNPLHAKLSYLNFESLEVVG